MDYKTQQLTNCLALATGALRALEDGKPGVKQIREMCERELFGAPRLGDAEPIRQECHTCKYLEREQDHPNGLHAAPSSDDCDHSSNDGQLCTFCRKPIGHYAELSSDDCRGCCGTGWMDVDGGPSRPCYCSSKDSP